MKFSRDLFTAIALCALPSTLAAWTNLTLSDYKLSVTGYSSVIADLDKALPIRSVKEVLASANHENPDSSPKVKNLLTSFTWENVPGYNDASGLKWFPQGVTTSADATETGAYNGDVVNLVSWHCDYYYLGKRGSRISFINMNEGVKRAYRNVLLVEPTTGGAEPNFQAIAGLHAGGIFWYGDFLYVASTNTGVRVFDLRHIYEVSEGNGIGRVGSGYQAFGYDYVLPQVRSYNWVPKTGVDNFRWSYIGLDRTSSPARMIAGEYNTGAPNRLIHFDLDSSTKLLSADSQGVATASQAVSHGLTKIQGTVTINDKYYMTQSGGSLWTFSWKDGEIQNKDVFPSVPQDLSYQAGYGLWGLMEMPWNRHVFAIDHKKF
ncbi:hypothetical protein AJ80_05431 [Polytolypa hystricis UAMH7299]|uniref:Secreted protein n=1 Tax=Polytolypa hystricis (strain UAMH7299) TaxID=1447883 RepID=A0A2B7Y3W4_POLH7|nr:hypothetical protein AJ80_05431 [Polytolypa hystricis UAMH7299]